MKIKSYITEKKEVEIDLQLPYYGRFDESFLAPTYYAVTDENTCIKLTNGGNYSNVFKCSPNLFQSEIANTVQISYSEFLKEYDKAMDSFQMPLPI